MADGAAQGTAGRSHDRLGGTAPLPGTRVLRCTAGCPHRRRFRCFRRKSLPTVLRQQNGRPFNPSWTLFSHAPCGLFRGDRQRAGHRMALSKTRSRIPLEVHEEVFGWVLKLIAGKGLVKGERIGVDGSTMEANAALRTIVRREDGKT